MCHVGKRVQKYERPNMGDSRRALWWWQLSINLYNWAWCIYVCLPLCFPYFNALFCVWFYYVGVALLCLFLFGGGVVADAYYANNCPVHCILITPYYIMFICVSSFILGSLEDCMLFFQCLLEPECIGCSHRIWCIWNSSNRLHKGEKST